MRAPFVGTTLLSWQLVADPHRKLVYRPTCRPHLNRFRAGGLIYSPIGDPFQGAAIYACTLVWLMVLTTQSFAAMFAGCLLVSARQLSFACSKRSAKDMAISGRTAFFNTCNKKCPPANLAGSISPSFRGVTGATARRWKALTEAKLFLIKPFQWLNDHAKLDSIFCFFWQLVGLHPPSSKTSKVQSSLKATTPPQACEHMNYRNLNLMLLKILLGPFAMFQKRIES